MRCRPHDVRTIILQVGEIAWARESRPNAVLARSNASTAPWRLCACANSATVSSAILVDIGQAEGSGAEKLTPVSVLRDMSSGSTHCHGRPWALSFLPACAGRYLRQELEVVIRDLDEFDFGVLAQRRQGREPIATPRSGDRAAYCACSHAQLSGSTSDAVAGAHNEGV